MPRVSVKKSTEDMVYTFCFCCYSIVNKFKYSINRFIWLMILVARGLI